jgi:hypothetical protein
MSGRRSVRRLPVVHATIQRVQVSVDADHPQDYRRPHQGRAASPPPLMSGRRSVRRLPVVHVTIQRVWVSVDADHPQDDRRPHQGRAASSPPISTRCLTARLQFSYTEHQ